MSEKLKLSRSEFSLLIENTVPRDAFVRNELF